MSRHVLYLDTNHLSEVARNPAAPSAAPVLRILQDDRARLAISLLHYIELASPAFTSVGDVKALLRDVPLAYALSNEEVWDAETAVACAKATGRDRTPPRVFCVTALDWCGGPSPTDGDAVDFLEALIEQPQLRSQVLDVAAVAAKVSMMKTQAAIVKQPELPLQLSVADHLQLFRQHNGDYAGGLHPHEVIAGAGGPTCFPSLNMFHCTLRERLSLMGQKSTSNDVLDEYHASYAPYSAATALDRRTAARVRTAQLADRHRVTAQLSDIPGLLERVEAGALLPEPSTW